ncbi:hypothetical protein IU405_13105 [Polaribacter sp. BAL334]|uniref:ATP-binding protein n=1 Tax=Polaribacter sp. BAL334 TaxID=1708178 RepID=UPI0018D2359F|nr:ATP-binding protein [Polaribacter sp. BAL334]MBG7613186.1 hypothetical protein [Polaribacter sp. BAL334]
MATKIKNIKIKGIRGAKETLDLNLNGKSILLYGDNGSGKSSISDAVEWFFTDKVSHLSSSEIELKDALRNATIPDTESSEVSISFTKTNLDCSKTLSLKKGKLIPEILNTTEEFSNYISNSNSENILLRYQYLTNFIDNTKGEKLKYLSDIIGFAEVTKKKEVLQKSHNSVKAEIKSQNFETQISSNKQILINKLGASISLEKQLFDTINEKIKSLNTGITINSIADIGKLLEHIKRPVNNNLTIELKFLDDTKNALNILFSEIDLIDGEYVKYFEEFNIIANDVDAIIKIYLGDLLNAANTVFKKKIHTDESCPLCLQPKNSNDLQEEIKVRLKEIEEYSKKKVPFDKAKKMVTEIVAERIKRLENVLLNTEINKAENDTIKKAVISLKTKIFEYQKAIDVKVTSGDKPLSAEHYKLKEEDFSILNSIIERIVKIEDFLKNDTITVLYSNILASKEAFLNIQKLDKQKVVLENQRKTLELIYNEFVKKQKEALEDFINSFSERINEFYQYMNPGEPFQEIKIVTIGEDDELNGITIEYKYNGNWVSPPQKYFSESHLNCFGLSFFLASVEAFNNENKFIILDDVISSFDSTHRKSFADLLFEKFSDYQIILLTHEIEWFTNIVSPLAKKNGWLTNIIRWTEVKGTHIDSEPKTLKDLVETSLADGITENLGNPIRTYLEHFLKDVCLNLDVKVSYKPNVVNEKRMADELINELKSRISSKSPDLKAKLPVIEKVGNSLLLGNLLSHDNPFNPKIGDLKAFWNDIIELEKLFICQEAACKKPKVSLINYDTVAKKIRCGCDTTKYDWSK